MKRYLLMLVLSLLCVKIFAQHDAVSKLIEIKQAVYSGKVDIDKVFSDLGKIEKECLSSNNDTTTGVYYSLKGQMLCAVEKYEECIPILKKAIVFLEKCNLRQYEYLDDFKYLGDAYFRTKDYENAERYYRRGILRSVSANVEKTNQHNAELYLNLGRLYEAKGDTALANECIRRSTLMQEDKVLDIAQWNYIEWENSCYDKIDVFKKEGKYREAVDQYDKMIEGRLKYYGKGEEYISAMYSKALLLSRYLGDYEAALPMFMDIIECGKEISSHNEWVCGSYNNMVLCYSYLNMQQELNSFLPEARDFLSKANNKGCPPHSIYRFAGNGAYWRNDYDMAIKYYELYLSPENERESGTGYDDITNQLSVSYLNTGRIEKAKNLLTKYLKTDEKRAKSKNPETLPLIYHNLGRAYMLCGDKKNALAFLDKSGKLQKKLFGYVFDKTLLYINECRQK